jgi:N6-L-threonylcarbamoyladenine synthase
VKILGIETSCDDTSAAVVDGATILSNVTASQDDIHAEFGGVVPELAARRHLETIERVINRALECATVAVSDLDAIAVTRGPGLVGSLLVGLSVARGLGLRSGRPVIGVNHLEGHVLSPLIGAELATPFLAMLVSGGHTAIYLVREVGDYAELAATRDDSAGEAFDKAAKMLGLGYPGGRVIDELARAGNSRAIRFPRGRVRKDPLALSFSGLKTSLWDFLNASGPHRSVAGKGTAASSPRAPDELRGHRMEDVCASFQEAIVDVLVDRARTLMDRLDVSRLAVAGGVSANSRLRLRMSELAGEIGGELVVPPLSLCTDNGAMIAGAAAMRAARGLEGEDLRAVSRLPLGPRLALA